MQATPFNRDEHIFRSPQLADLLKDAIRFFNGTPVYDLPPPENFIGSGIYAVYYIGSFSAYLAITERNRLAYNLPIYIGKAIPDGGRKGKGSVKETASIFNRLNQHTKSIKTVSTLNIQDFKCRFIIIPHDEDALISPIESALIKNYNPLWNAKVEGFGNHDPGTGRDNQARSSWDVLHPGREFAERLKSLKGDKDIADILKEIEEYQKELSKNNEL